MSVMEGGYSRPYWDDIPEKVELNKKNVKNFLMENPNIFNEIIIEIRKEKIEKIKIKI